MVSSSTISLPLILYLSLFSSFFFISPSQSHNNNNNNNKVSLALYYESLCPYCSNFIVNYLPKIFKDDDLISIVDLNLVPWGNAKLRGGSNFTCQHGPNECLLNTVEACAIAAWPELSKHFPFIYCVEDLVYQGKYNEWESCFQKLGLDSRPINHCYEGEIGKQLELKYAAETTALQPPHKYVPWVVVNGKPLYEDYENFLSYVCEAYQGTHKPKSCSEASYLSTAVEAMPKHSVSDMEE